MPSLQSYRPTVLLTAVLITLWAIAGFIVNRNQGFSDAFYGPDYVVPGVIPGGPAEVAGFRAGDRVVTLSTFRSRGSACSRAGRGRSRRGWDNRNGLW